MLLDTDISCVFLTDVTKLQMILLIFQDNLIKNNILSIIIRVS